MRVEINHFSELFVRIWYVMANGGVKIRADRIARYPGGIMVVQQDWQNGNEVVWNSFVHFRFFFSSCFGAEAVCRGKDSQSSQNLTEKVILRFGKKSTSKRYV